MSDQDSLLRLQNALATLAEIASRHDERIAKHDESIAKHSERIAQLDEVLKQQAERVANGERAIQILIELQRTASDRADDHMTWINELGAARAEFETKLAALTDAQINTEDALRRLTDAQAQSDQSLSRLAEAQAVADTKFAELTGVVKRIAEAQGHSDRRHDGPAGPAGGGRNE